MRALREPLANRFQVSGAEPAWRDVAHPQQVLARYLQHHDETAKRDLLERAVAALSGSAALYKPAFERWMKSAPEIVEAVRLKVPDHQRLILGLGNDSVLETGLTLHHTYGVPYLPATSLKGVAAHYAHQVLGANDKRFRMAFDGRPAGEFAEVLFGSQDAGGLIEFSDGWIDPDHLSGCLKLDVMTPHHGPYYMAGAEDNDHPPTDFDDPVPVPFLAVANAVFHVRLTCRGLQRAAIDDAGRWLILANDVLAAAVSTLGLGGKTSSGYGRMINQTAATL